MKKVAKTNQEILNQILTNASMEYQNVVPEALGYGGNVSDVFAQYPSAKNEFINTLTNQVVRSVIYSKVFNNPLQMFHGGKLEVGQSIEQLFVDMAEVKGFLEMEQNDEVKDLIATSKPDVHALYVSRNYAYKSKVSISEEQLASAFRSQDGLAQLVNHLASSIVSGIYYQEFKDMKAIINGHARGEYLARVDATGKMVGTKLTNTALPGGQSAKVVNVGAYETEEAKGKAVSEAVRGLAGRLRFPSTEYNSAKVLTWSNPEDLVFITTPEMVAKLDVNVLAQAFNISLAELNVRTVIVDELPTEIAPSAKALATGLTPAKANVYGILVDKAFIVAKDTVNQTETMRIPNHLKTNMWYHKQGIMSTCYFANYVIIAE